MRLFRYTAGIASLLAWTCFAGCSQETSNLSLGMEMNNATQLMEGRGLTARQMSYSVEHQAYDLSDGRTIVLMGEKTVDKIEVITNPDAPSVDRKSTTVTTFQF